MQPGNDNPLSYRRAMELNGYSHNDETMLPSFKLYLCEFGTPQGIKFLGQILRTNKIIEYLAIYLSYTEVPDVCFEGVLHFISHNPSLRTLRIDDTGIGEKESTVEEKTKMAGTLRLILGAASKNPHIEKITVGAIFSQYLPSSSQEKVELSSTLKELELFMTEAAVNSWPNVHSLQTLRLHVGYYRLNPVDYQKNLSLLMGKLKDSVSSQKIKYLRLAGWSPLVPTFLFSPNCALVTLRLKGLRFDHRGDELYSLIDGLLWGLAGSKQTTDLILETCSFDSTSYQKILQGLQSSLLGIQRLDFITIEGGALDKEFTEHLFGCDRLHSLGFESTEDEWEVGHIDANIDSVKRGIEKCSLTALKLSTDRLASFGDALMSACTNNALTDLTLTNCEFSANDASCLANLIEDNRSQLRKLTINEYFSSDDELISSVFKALEGTSKLEILRIETQSDKEISLGLSKSLGKLKSLTSLQIMLGHRLSPNDEQSIATAMSKNWILESMLVVGADNDLLQCGDRRAEPVISHGLKTKLKKFTDRNKFKKAILESPVSMSKAEIKGWFNKLGSVWELPDGFTLAFQLLQLRPGCFFKTG